MRIEELISESELQERVKELAIEIRAACPSDPLVLIGVLKGCVPFLADIAREIEGDVLIDYMQVSSYGDDKSSSGVVKLKKDHDINIEGKHVLLCEDIVDTGLTLAHLRELLMTRKPASLRVCAMLNKSEARTHSCPIEFTGFDIPNKFVVGYGLDYAERYRNLPYVAVLHLD